jgi:hypothetical protein
VISYKRPGQSSGVAIVWRVAQILALLLVAVSFFFVAKDFDITF